MIIKSIFLRILASLCLVVLALIALYFGMDYSSRYEFISMLNSHNLSYGNVTYLGESDQAIGSRDRVLVFELSDFDGNMPGGWGKSTFVNVDTPEGPPQAYTEVIGYGKTLGKIRKENVKTLVKFNQEVEGYRIYLIVLNSEMRPRIVITNF